MATATRKKEHKICSCKVLLSGRVAPHVQANIIKVMLKHLMFQRNQIPMTYEQMKFEYQRQSTMTRSHVKSDVGYEKGGQEGHQELSSAASKRLGQLIASVEEQLANVDNLFTLSFVPRVLILFGATAVSPKEVHEIVFINQASVHDSSLTDLRTKHCVRALMKTLIADSSVWDAKQLPLTNTMLLVRAHRNSGLTWFNPKIALKVPRRGQLYRCEIHCGYVEHSYGCHGGCALDKGNSDGCHGNCVLDGGNSEGSIEEGSPNSLAENDDYIWYQAPVPIKGVKAFASKTSASSDIWA